MDIQELKIPGCFLIKTAEFEDDRGSFVKTFHADIFSDKGISFKAKEEFYSFSNKDVIRGLHFQTPPHAHQKLVFCAQGKVWDFFVDIREASPTFGKVLEIELSVENHHALFLPVGIAHGFLTLENNSLMIYKTDTVYAPENDTGILWSSIHTSIEVEAPIISGRDSSFVSFSNFETPFK